jgi:putative PIN family toxin of toxin-antitoxin system
VLGACVLDELAIVLRDKFKVSATTAREIDAFLRDHEIVARPQPPYPVKVRDPDDEVVLASALQARVDVLVSGDQDLLELAGRASLRILSPREFWALARQGGS